MTILTWQGDRENEIENENEKRIFHTLLNSCLTSRRITFRPKPKTCMGAVKSKVRGEDNMTKRWNVISKRGTQVYGVEWSGVEWSGNMGRQRGRPSSRAGRRATLPRCREVGEVVRHRQGTRLGRGFESHSSQTSFAPGLLHRQGSRRQNGHMGKSADARASVTVHGTFSAHPPTNI